MDYYTSSERYTFNSNLRDDTHIPLDYTSADMFAPEQSFGSLVQPPFQASYTFLPYHSATYDPSANSTQYVETYSGADSLASYPSELPLHAPIPLSGYSSLLGSAPPVAPTSEPPIPVGAHRSVAVTIPAHDVSSTPRALSDNRSPLEYYGNTPQVMFPTPCELLTDISTRDRSASGSTNTNGTEAAEVAEAANAPRKSKSSEKQPENQRKAYFRAVAESVGFQPTDPDTITSHDKKRSYLECLEQYVQWLHEQIRLVGHEPIAIERVSTYRGLNSRSIRTLLVHMQDEIRKLNVRIAQEERDYVRLQSHVLEQTGGADALEMRRHSIASCSVQDATLPAFAPAPQ
ncbi:hypothetical protein CERSUDRAFT_120988 [Gelatoporia subvermispora B]|uniref:Uncharacterized protein n=1 Tax=Ceriporiopsis subvermispora (strain B) TaxID=914234 RepID=M2QYH6_CERS8|nr:hypothetical protein CERSUDRAFT_120988 [Gelatoporia subvermispora B]